MCIIITLSSSFAGVALFALPPAKCDCWHCVHKSNTGCAATPAAFEMAWRMLVSIMFAILWH